VKISGFFDVHLIAGSEGKITVEGESNIIEFIECKVDGNSLTIGVEKGKRISPSAGKSITVTVPFESLNEVTLAGSGDVTSKSTIKATDFTTTLSGSGDIKLHVDAQQVNAKVTGSGNMTLKGNRAI
jgi:type 1 fimbria pilin